MEALISGEHSRTVESGAGKSGQGGRTLKMLPPYPVDT